MPQQQNDDDIGLDITRNHYGDSSVWSDLEEEISACGASLEYYRQRRSVVGRRSSGDSGPDDTGTVIG